MQIRITLRQVERMIFLLVYIMHEALRIVATFGHYSPTRGHLGRTPYSKTGNETVLTGHSLGASSSSW